MKVSKPWKTSSIRSNGSHQKAFLYSALISCFIVFVVSCITVFCSLVLTIVHTEIFFFKSLSFNLFIGVVNYRLSLIYLNSFILFLLVLLWKSVIEQHSLFQSQWYEIVLSIFFSNPFRGNFSVFMVLSLMPPVSLPVFLCVMCWRELIWTEW